MRLRKALAAVAVGLCAAALGCGGSLEYRFQPEMDQTYEFTMETESNVQTVVMGMKVEMDQKAVQKADLAFSPAEDGAVAARYTFTESSVEPSIRAALPIPENALEPLKAVYQSMVGQSFTAVMDRAGRVVKIEGMKEMIAAMMQSLDAPPEAQAMMSQAIESALGDEQMDQILSQSYPYVPTGGVDVGDSWESTVGAQGVGVKSRFELTKREKGLATIAVNGEFAPGGSGGMQMNIPGMGGIETEFKELTGAFRGVYTLDEATGIAVAFDLDIAMDALFEVKMEQLQALGGLVKVPPVEMKNVSKIVGRVSRAGE